MMRMADCRCSMVAERHELRLPEGNRYAYTGREWDDELGLYHYRARMYDALSGRFLSRDPIGYLDGPSLFAYAGSNPNSRSDPSGYASAVITGNCKCSRGAHAIHVGVSVYWDPMVGVCAFTTPMEAHVAPAATVR